MSPSTPTAPSTSATVCIVDAETAAVHDAAAHGVPMPGRCGVSIYDLIHETFLSVTNNKVRSSLTILGIVVGIASVILMVSIGQGSQASITASIQSAGANLLTVSSGGGRFGGFGGGGVAVRAGGGGGAAGGERRHAHPSGRHAHRGAARRGVGGRSANSAERGRRLRVSA